MKGGTPVKRFLLSPRRLSFIMVGLCAGLGLCFSQTAFERTYGSTGNDEAYSVQQTTDGGYIVVGSADLSGTGNLDVYLIKTNSSGDTLWTRTYGGAHEDRGYAVRQTSDGGYIIAGYAASFGSGSCHIFVVKTTSSGSTLWAKSYAYSDTSFDIARSIEQTSDGGYIIAGFTYRFGTFRGATSDAYLIKTNSSGDTLWTKTYGGAREDRGYEVQQTSDGGYIVAGYTASSGASPYHCYVVKTTSSGNLLWTKTLARNDTCHEIARSLTLTSDGGYIIAGFADSYDPVSNDDVYLVKMTSSGDTVWTRRYGDTAHTEYGLSIRQTSDGGYIVVGSRWSLSTNESQVYHMKTNSSGDTLWTRTYGGPKEQEGTSVRQTSDGGYIIAGYTSSFGGGNYDMYLIKTRADGLVSVRDDRNVLPAAFALLQNYPNPFNPSTTIRYGLPHKSQVSLTVYNVLGQQVATLVQGEQEVGYHEVRFEASGFSSGVYFYRLQANDFASTGKLLLLR
jgi:uncharacterized delta-60 repeat protein